MKRLAARFFERDSVEVAPDLLNKLLVVGDRVGRIVEVEAYTRDDPASHSFRGPTKRNAVTCTGAATACLTGPAGDGQAVLIRAVICDGVDRRSTNGPGKVCRHLGIDMSFNGTIANIVDDGVAAPNAPLVTARIGISKAIDRQHRWLVG